MTAEKEWMDQHLASVTPLPFGERVAPHRRWSRARPWVRGWRAAVQRGIFAAGVIAGLCGAALVAWPSETRVSMDAASYRIGNSELVRVEPGVYKGGAVLVVRSQSRGAAAGSSFVVDGHRGTGACSVDSRVGMERCVFHIEGRPDMRALDVFSDGGWQREYVGGAHVTIAAQAPVPVPFPVGADQHVG